jgi:hypothetical protein
MTIVGSSRKRKQSGKADRRPLVPLSLSKDADSIPVGAIKTQVDRRAGFCEWG